MDLNLAQKLIKYNPTDVQTVTYVVEYAQHNYEGDAVQTYINERLTGKTQREIAEIVLETALANTIKAKPSAASGKIETPKEKPSTEGATSAAMKSIEAKGDAKKAEIFYNKSWGSALGAARKGFDVISPDIPMEYADKILALQPQIAEKLFRDVAGDGGVRDALTDFNLDKIEYNRGKGFFEGLDEVEKLAWKISP